MRGLGDAALPQLRTASVRPAARGRADPADALALAACPAARPWRRAAAFPTRTVPIRQMSVSFHESDLRSHCDLFQVA